MQRITDLGFGSIALEWIRFSRARLRTGKTDMRATTTAERQCQIPGRRDTHLQHVDEVHVVSLQHLFDELDQFVFELSFALQPRGVEVQTQRGAVGAEVTVEVVSEQTAELFAGLDV